MDCVLTNRDNYWEFILLPFYLNKVIKKDSLGHSFVSKLQKSRSLKGVEGKGDMKQIINDPDIKLKSLKTDVDSIEKISEKFINIQKEFFTKIENDL